MLRRRHRNSRARGEAIGRRHQMEWKKIRSWWPYALLGIDGSSETRSEFPLQAVVFCTLHDTESARLLGRDVCQWQRRTAPGLGIAPSVALYSIGVRLSMTESVPGFHRDCGLVGITPVICRGYPSCFSILRAARAGGSLQACGGAAGGFPGMRQHVKQHGCQPHLADNSTSSDSRLF